MPKLSGRKDRGLIPKVPKRKGVLLTHFAESVRRYRQIMLTGRVMAVDPSSGSRESMPGYSVFEAGRLVEAGSIRLPLEAELHVRLQELRRCLMTQFATPDVLVIENLPPFVNGFNKSILSLHKSVGVIISSFDVGALVEIAPSMWHKHEPEGGYYKSDVNDAILMGYVALKEAYTQSGIEVPAYLEQVREKTREPNK